MEHKELANTLMGAISAAMANAHTTTIAKVISVGSKTIDVKPVINRVVNGESIELPVFQKVPPIFLGGGGSSLAFPVKEGDYCLLVFTERCFDNWYAGRDFQSPLELRVHDYSDALAIVGLKNESGALTIPSDMTFTGDLIIDGNLTVNGDVEATGDVKADGVSLKNHTHTYAWTGSPGSGSTGAPS